MLRHHQHHHLRPLLSPTLSYCTKSDLTRTHTVTPPVTPWPTPLLPRRFALLLRRQPRNDIPLLLRIFRHASVYDPTFHHNALTYHTLIQLLARARAFPDLHFVLSHLASSKVRCPEDAFITVIRAFSFAGKPSKSLKMFLDIKPKFRVNASVRSFNAVLNAMVQNKRYSLVPVLFKNLKSKKNSNSDSSFEHVVPNICTCNILVKALCEMGNLGGARKVLEEIPHWGMVPNLVTYTTVMGGYCVSGDVGSAVMLFEEVVELGWKPDAAMYTVLVDGYCRLGRVSDAVKLMDDMDLNDVPPNEITYDVMIRSLCDGGKAGEALSVLNDMLEDGRYMPQPSLCCKVIDCLCVDGKADDACGLWRKMLKSNCMPDNSILCTIIHWLCKEGKVKEAMSLFREFDRAFYPSIRTYNTLISGMCDNGELQEAGRLWDHMMEKRCSPNVLTYNILVKGFCEDGMVEQGVEVYKEMLRKGFAPSKLTHEVLLDGITQLGSNHEEKVLEEVLHLAASTGTALEHGECWDVFLRKAVVIETEKLGQDIDRILHM